MTNSPYSSQAEKSPGPLGRYRRFLAARFDPRTFLGLHLTTGLLVGAAGVWAFSALLDAVLDNDTLVQLDVAADAWIHAHVTPLGLQVFDAITQIGSPPSMIILGVVVALVLWRQHRRTTLIAWIAAFAGGEILNLVIKNLVHRTRPTFGAAYLKSHSFSFPSGHAMGSIIGIGMLLYVLGLYWHPSKPVRVASVFAGVVAVILIGVSRIYLGVHYPSDVLGGWAAGAAWVAVCLTGSSFALHRHDPVSSS